MAALGFGPDGINTLVSMATDSSHRVIMGKCFDLLFLEGKEDSHNILDEFKIQPESTTDCMVSCP